MTRLEESCHLSSTMPYFRINRYNVVRSIPSRFCPRSTNLFEDGTYPVCGRAIEKRLQILTLKTTFTRWSFHADVNQ